MSYLVNEQAVFGHCPLKPNGKPEPGVPTHWHNKIPTCPSAEVRCLSACLSERGHVDRAGRDWPCGLALPAGCLPLSDPQILSFCLSLSLTLSVSLDPFGPIDTPD
ncbi:hypothetical protein TCAL_08995 [Tigriopus californicus]|uniref:Uncharacterized protein n=1 Tax=Tigriopus californicus TaxID=6832 RepID=A0A553PJA0_TIGCA|nr:hypothetical protein TCAL_08995 [Tigriopus californicus]